MYKGLVDRDTNPGSARSSDGISVYITQSGKSHGPFYIHHNHIKGFFHGQIVVTAYSSTYTSLDEIYIWENELDGEDSHAGSYMRGLSACSKNSFIFRNYFHDLSVRCQNYFGNVHNYNNVYANLVVVEPDVGGFNQVGGAGIFNAREIHRFYNNTYYSLDESAISMAWNGAGSLALVDIRNNVFHDCGSGNSGNRTGTNNRTEDILLYDKTSRGFSNSLLTVSELNGESFAGVSAENNIGPDINPSMQNPAGKIFKYDSDIDPGVDAGQALIGPSMVGLNPPPGIAMEYKDAIHPHTDFKNFTSTVDTIVRPQREAWDIGAIEYISFGEPAPPTGLKIIYNK